MEQQATEVPDKAAITTDVVAPINSPGQKRSRYYGEELKGLTSDEDDQASSPVAKKAKMRREGSESPAESVDDGEIVESSPSRSVSEQPAEVSEAKTTDLSSAETAQKPATGFNRGVSLGVRTSFGKDATTPFPTTQSTSASAIVDTISLPSSSPTSSLGEIEQSTSDDAPTSKKPNTLPLSFTCGKYTWEIPRSEVLYIPQTPDAQTPAYWHRKLPPLIVAIFRANGSQNWDGLDTRALRTGLDKYVSKDGGFLEGANKHMKGVRKALQQATTDRIALAAMIQRARKEARTEPPHDQPIDPEELRQNCVSGDEERWQQERYFPGAEDASQYCVSCSGQGHRARECPQLACRFCNSTGHTSFGCPTKQRCMKCRQIGHGLKACTEKLALTADEQTPCAFCGGAHLEDECSEIWRSFNPNSTTIRKVKAIPSFCYSCGGEDHYGSECALPGREGRLTGRTSWSRENRDTYVDPQSDAVAIAWVGVVEPPSEFHIRGRATRSTHTHFVSDEESDDGFIHEPVKKPQDRGQIRIATNIGNGTQGPRNGMRPRYGKHEQGFGGQSEPEYEPPPAAYPGVVGPPPSYNGGAQWQPPLPAGPPPPLATNGFQGAMTSLPAARPASLPVRPDTFSQGNGRGQAPRSQNGRGGRGGRGRGRGRGRGGGVRGRGQ